MPNAEENWDMISTPHYPAITCKIHTKKKNPYLSAMKITIHQHEQMVFHMVGAKCGINKNNHNVTKLEHGI
jgi:hypothetical protein